MALFKAWLPKLLTEKEIKLLQKRFKLIQFLKTKLTYREIAFQMGISTATVVKLNQRLRIRKQRKKGKSSSKGRAMVANKYKDIQKQKLPWLIGG